MVVLPSSPLPVRGWRVTDGAIDADDLPAGEAFSGAQQWLSKHICLEGYLGMEDRDCH